MQTGSAMKAFSSSQTEVTAAPVALTQSSAEMEILAQLLYTVFGLDKQFQICSQTNVPRYPIKANVVTAKPYFNSNL